MDISVRNVPDDLWRQVRILAVTKDMTIRELLLTALREYLDSQQEPKARPRLTPTRSA